jgi:hypothetical protein
VPGDLGVDSEKASLGARVAAEAAQQGQREGHQSCDRGERIARQPDEPARLSAAMGGKLGEQHGMARADRYRVHQQAAAGRSQHRVQDVCGACRRAAGGDDDVRFAVPDLGAQLLRPVTDHARAVQARSAGAQPRQ